MLKSILQKLDDLTHTELKNNISKELEKIPKEKYVSNKKTLKIKKNYL